MFIILKIITIKVSHFHHMQAAALYTDNRRCVLAIPDWTLIPYYLNSEVASTYYRHYQGRRLPDEHSPFKLSSRDTEKMRI